MRSVVSHPHTEKAELLMVSLGEWLILLLLLASSKRLQGLANKWVLALLEEELKRPGQVLMGKSEVGPGDIESA